MGFSEREGDLFEQGVPALGHGVNLQGGMGGLAGAFEDRWPDLADDYRDACLDGRLVLGGVLPWVAPDGTVVYNLATQLYSGTDARLDAIDAALRAALDDAVVRRVPIIGLPRIGAGIGGLDWSDVEHVVRSAAEASIVDVVVVTLPER